MKKTKQKIKLLIVDDHQAIREGIVAMLSYEKKIDFDIVDAATGKEAIEKAIKHKFDVVLMDVDGGELCHGIENCLMGNALFVDINRTRKVLLTIYC